MGVFLAMADHQQGRAWFLFPPTAEQIEEEKEKALFLSTTQGDSTNLAVNYMGILIAFIFVLVVIQLMMPSLRQIGDFFSAVYAPYGEDEVADNRYDYSYSDDYKPYMQQFRNFNEVPDLTGDRLRSLGAVQPQTSLLSPLLNCFWNNCNFHF